MKDYLKQLKRNSSQIITAVKLIIFPLFLYLLFFFVFQINASLEKEASRFVVAQESASAPIAPYPVLQNAYTPVISAESAVIMDDTSKVTIYAKNPDIRFSMASTTKLMTALTALEAFDLSDSLLVYRDGAQGSVVGLVRGEQYTLESLMLAMLLPSANDAANAIADNYPGGRAAFVKRMNEKADELTLYDTAYYDPSGLEDDGNYTTARDLARLASIATADETIARITGTKNSVIRDSSGKHVIALKNLNELLGINGVVGIKTGFTQGAGGVLTTAREDNGHKQIIVVMRSTDRFGDTQRLLTMITGKLSYVVPQYSPLSQNIR